MGPFNTPEIFSGIRGDSRRFYRESPGMQLASHVKHHHHHHHHHHQSLFILEIRQNKVQLYKSLKNAVWSLLCCYACTHYCQHNEMHLAVILLYL